MCIDDVLIIRLLVSAKSATYVTNISSEKLGAVIFHHEPHSFELQQQAVYLRTVRSCVDRLSAFGAEAKDVIVMSSPVDCHMLLL